MKTADQNSPVQKEALLNECKGNLFEFLVAQKLSKAFKNEDTFLLKLPRDFKNILKTYEETIRLSDEKLLLNLPLLAHSTTAAILDLPIFQHTANDFEFLVIGKMVAGSDNETWNETDIVALEKLANGEQKKHFLSLKLIKDHSYANTKSAGAKSFIQKYFSVFQDAISFQLILNQEVDESFHMMGHKLYLQNDLDFHGSFDHRWPHSELPGELSEGMREIVHANYHRVSLKIFELLQRLQNKNPKQFGESLESLCGFGDKGIIQIYCFHHETQLKEIMIKSYTDFFDQLGEEQDEGKLIAPRNNGASVDVVFSKFQLQIRVKPMNKFTTAAYKINCSIKMTKPGIK